MYTAICYCGAVAHGLTREQVNVFLMSHYDAHVLECVKAAAR